MAFGFQLLPTGLEEGHFQEVPEGWLFTSPSPWVFASRRTYLLTEAQKPAIAARVRRGLYLRLLWLIPLLPILVAVVLYYPAIMNFNSAASWGGFLAIGVCITVIYSLSDYFNVRPLLHDIPRSSQKIRLRNMMQGQTRALSVKALAIFTLIFVLGFLANGYNALAFRQTGPFAAIGAIAMLVFAIAFGAMLRVKLRARRAENEAGLSSEQLSARLSRIERSSVVQTFGIAALMILALIAGVMLGNLYDQSDNASVRSLVLRNAKGDVIASLRTGSDGLPVFALWDGNNKLRAALGLSKSGTPFFALSDSDGKIRSSMTMLTSPDAAKQNAVLQFYDETGKFRMWTGLNERGPHLWMYDKNTVLRLSATVDEGGPHLRTLDEFGKETPK
jgi:hypothetical protein